MCCGGVRGPDRARRHSPRRVVRYPLAVLKQALEEKAKAVVPEVTTLLDAGKPTLRRPRRVWQLWSRRRLPYRVLCCIHSRSSMVCRTDGRSCLVDTVGLTPRSGQEPHTPGGTEVVSVDLGTLG